MEHTEPQEVERSDESITSSGPSTVCCDSKFDPAATDSPEERIQKATKEFEIAKEDLSDRDDPDEVLSYHVQGAISSGRKAIAVIEQREDTQGRGGSA